MLVRPDAVVPRARDPEYEFPHGCRNCGGEAPPEHPDICCTCFAIAFGNYDHRREH